MPPIFCPTCDTLILDAPACPACGWQRPRAAVEAGKGTLSRRAVASFGKSVRGQVLVQPVDKVGEADLGRKL